MYKRDAHVYSITHYVKKYNTDNQSFDFWHSACIYNCVIN